MDCASLVTLVPLPVSTLAIVIAQKASQQQFMCIIASLENPWDSTILSMMKKLPSHCNLGKAFSASG
jgi:hypothetical protein